MMNPMDIFKNAVSNSPVGRMMQMVKSGNNPQALMQTMIQKNPKLQQAIPLIQGKNPKQLETVFCNLCKQRGMDPQEAIKQFCMNSPNGGSNT